MVRLERVRKAYAHPDGTEIEALRDVSFEVAEGEFFAVVGPSGCGKTTILKLIAGLVRPTSGNVKFEGREVSGSARERGMVFQQYASLPWLTVSENIAFGPRLRNEPEERTQSVVARYLKLTGLEEFADRYPGALSGGMQQRVALARTLANDPKVLLLDEPLGALDTQTRSQMQEFLATLWEKERKTLVLVTHDIEEAIFLADRVAVLTPRPAQVKQELPVRFPRPRTHELKFATEFIELKRQITGLL